MNSMSAEKPAHRPDACPFCHSKAIGTLAKVITARTYWRCQACGEVWNEDHLRLTRSGRHRQDREG